MILIYLDESGINYKIEDGFYRDGPFLIMGAMFISEDVYWSMERLFTQLIDKYFGIDDWLKTEVHATDIWHGDTIFGQVSIRERKAFFDEFLQLCGKFHLPYLFSFVLKQQDQTDKEKNSDMLRAAQCLLVNIEHRLAEIHQTGVLICDSSSASERLKIVDIINIDISNQELSPSKALLKIFYEMTSWRSTKKFPSFTIQPKYVMEYMSAYLIDRVHFLNSSDSLFLQMCDIMTFLVQRLLTHDYLLVADNKRIVEDKVPISRSGLSMMRNRMFACTYSQKDNDVSFTQILEYPQRGFLLEFSALGFGKDIKEHYERLSALPQ
jgi:hypothetical protein